MQRSGVEHTGAGKAMIAQRIRALFGLTFSFVVVLCREYSRGGKILSLRLMGIRVSGFAGATAGGAVDKSQLFISDMFNKKSADAAQQPTTPVASRSSRVQSSRSPEATAVRNARATTSGALKNAAEHPNKVIDSLFKRKSGRVRPSPAALEDSNIVVIEDSPPEKKKVSLAVPQKKRGATKKWPAVPPRPSRTKIENLFAPKRAKQTWSCAACTFMNNSTGTSWICSACGTTTPAHKVKVCCNMCFYGCISVPAECFSPPFHFMQVLSWSCPQCTLVNDASSTLCNVCGFARKS